MSCHAIRNWTFSELVGAFLDIAIASLLLCASTLAYFASAFLSLFGLNLPCSCNGLFENSNGQHQHCMQSQLRRLPAQKISFVQCSVKNKFPFHSSCQGERNEKHEAPDEAVSCLSSSDRTEDLANMKEKGFVIGAINLPDFKERKFSHRRSRSHNNIRRRRRGSANDNRKLPWNFSNISFCSDDSPPPSVTRLAEDTADVPKNNVNIRDDKESLLDIGSKRKISHGFDLSESMDENEPNDNENGEDNNAKNTIRLLQEALEEEHAARSVLYVELDKERNAASTAADEAMAMILRLQEEKASIEMESRQRQRIVEDRYAYDEEEMDILKEILVRREKEKYFLEKEVEAYRQLMSNEQFLESDTPCAAAALAKGEFTLYLSDDESVVVMPQHSDEYPVMKFIEDDNRSTIIEESEPRKSSAVITEIVELFNSDETENENENESIGKIHDVHVIDDKCIVSMEEEKTHNRMISGNSSSASAKTTNTTPVIIAPGLPPTGKSKSWRSEMRRKSMSSFDAERFRIDNEIGWLREKLKFVHEGREKLNFNKNMRGREKINQGQVLEDITSHLREIRHLTEPGKTARRASLPPLSSNVMSKKRRWRNGGTLMVQGSI
ncbi:hypothetical protein M5689_014584 [Euphorbia peplus]|nr:hypothetical protein M5689_014584 [Euphorbia peplus]